MKQVIFNEENPNGVIVEVEDVAGEPVSAAAEPIKEFFEGLASTDTNSIAKIRELAKAFLANTAGGE